MKEEQRKELYKRIFGILISRGIKATTMDNVAQSLGMSKRTLYEIFGSKNDMVCTVLYYMHDINKQQFEEVFSTEENVLRALVKIFNLQVSAVAHISLDFLRDLDEMLPEFRKEYRSETRDHSSIMRKVFRKGVEEGVFRTGLDYGLQAQMFRVQIEAIKRSEAILPAEMTFSDVYAQIAFSFLRSIATVKGLEIIEQYDGENPFKL